MVVEPVKIKGVWRNPKTPSKRTPVRSQPDGWASARFWKFILNYDSFAFSSLILPAALITLIRVHREGADAIPRRVLRERKPLGRRNA